MAEGELGRYRKKPAVAPEFFRAEPFPERSKGNSEVKGYPLSNSQGKQIGRDMSIGNDELVIRDKNYRTH